MIGAWLKDTRHKIIVMTALIFLLGALAGKHFFIDQDFKTLKDISVQMTAEKQKEETLKHIQDLDNKIKSYEKYFVNTEDGSWLIENVNRLAKASGVALVSMTPQQAEAGEDIGKFVLRLEARCGFHELGKFVSGIESEARFIKISEVSAQSAMGAEASSGKKMTVTMSLTAYYPRENTLT